MIREITIKLTEEIEDVNTICSLEESEQWIKDRIKYNFASCNVEIIKSEDVNK
jgi:hypothetical protein